MLSARMTYIVKMYKIEWCSGMKSVFGIDMFLHGKVMQPMADGTFYSLGPDGQFKFAKTDACFDSETALINFFNVCSQLPGPERRTRGGVRDRGAASSPNPKCCPGVCSTARLDSGSYSIRCRGENLLKNLFKIKQQNCFDYLRPQ